MQRNNLTLLRNKMNTELFIIKRLNSQNKEDILNHFKELDQESRYNRFCSATNETSLSLYVSKINIDNHGYFGVFNKDLKMIGLGECVFFKSKDGKHNEAEVAFSILKEYQGNGLGNKLLKRLIRFAKINDIEKLQMYCLRNNSKVIHLCKKYGLHTEVTPYESNAYISMPSDETKHTEKLDEIIDDSMADIAIANQRNIKFFKSNQKFFQENLQNFLSLKISLPLFYNKEDNEKKEDVKKPTKVM